MVQAEITVKHVVLYILLCVKCC